MQFENKGIPINENTPFEASSPYSIARIQSNYAARYFSVRQSQMNIVYAFLQTKMRGDLLPLV